MRVASPLQSFHAPTQAWFRARFDGPTRAQALAWPALAAGRSTLLCAPTGTGKTLAAFLAGLDRLAFGPPPPRTGRCRILYVSPLKALAVDVEKNLRGPLEGIRQEALRLGAPLHELTIGVRTGDTKASERARFQRSPTDLLVTTPESLYLLLTSRARDALASIETVILDEIHALVPHKRGSHLAVSLERLEQLCGRPLQRIGLSATQRPLHEVARFLGGVAADGQPRPIEVLDASAEKRLSISVQVPADDLTGAARQAEPLVPGQPVPSIWTAIVPELLVRIRAHRTTLVFVNARRAAERLTAALNEAAGEVLALAHHGSLSREQRTVAEERLKAGSIPCLVATSSLELGIDMGAIELVVLIEAPPSVAAGLQRIGRAAHHLGGESVGVIVPKFRGDLLTAATMVPLLHEGAVEPTHYPRLPLDVLAQQLVAMTAVGELDVEASFALVKGAAPFAELPRETFLSVLELLSGHYPSDEFGELRARLTWDREAGTLRARDGARRLAVINGGTIPDKGLYPVFLQGAGPKSGRVGELDEEMVYETRRGDVFVLGASSWRVEEITHDRVLVTPAPGEPGRIPFWKADGPGRPMALGRAIGALSRELRAMAPELARARLRGRHALDDRGVDNLLTYLDEQAQTGAVPDDRTIVLEHTRDELGDLRITVLTPFGARIHTPWALAAVGRLQEALGQRVLSTVTDDGFVLRLPERQLEPAALPERARSALIFPGPEEIEALVLRELPGSPLFAAVFRESAARALLLPRRRPGQRTPLWMQRKRASDLLTVAQRHPSFPILLEAHRELLRDHFDLPALRELLQDVQQGRIRVAATAPDVPSPWAASILFSFVAGYLYDGDAPAAERRAQALAVDPTQLAQLLGEGELRSLLDPEELARLVRELRGATIERRVRGEDALQDRLREVGELSLGELQTVVQDGVDAAALAARLVEARRALWVTIAGEARLVAVEDAARVRDGLGCALPAGLPAALLTQVPDARLQLVRRFARTNGPFTRGELARRFGLPEAALEREVAALLAARRLVEGAFRPGGRGAELCDAEVLERLRRRSLSRARRAVEPVPPAAFVRHLTAWHGLVTPRAGLDALLDVIERLQGVPMPASRFERELLAPRVKGFSLADLDELLAAGEVRWVGVEPLGEKDGRIALYLSDRLAELHDPTPGPPPAGREAALLGALARLGASYFGALHDAAGGGFPQETIEALWGLVFRGLVTNDGLFALRQRVREAEPSRGRGNTRFRSRRALPGETDGRWSLLPAPVGTPTTRAIARAQQWLVRHGVLLKEALAAEGASGAERDVLDRLEATGRIRRGHFVEGLGGRQLALPEALDRLRALREPGETKEVLRLAAIDPAQPYGSVLPWPTRPPGALAPSRSLGASVVLVDGHCAAFLARGGGKVTTFAPPSPAQAERFGSAVAERLAALAAAARVGLLVEEVDGRPADEHPLAPALRAAGFSPALRGFHLRSGQTFVRGRAVGAERAPLEDE